MRRNNDAIIEKIDMLGGPEAVARDPVAAADIAAQLGLTESALKQELAMHFETVRMRPPALCRSGLGFLPLPVLSV